MNGTTPRVRTEPFLAELLTLTQRRVVRVVATALAEERFTLDQWRILHALNDGGHAMGELAESLAMPAPTLTRLVEGLVDQGLVYRRQGNDDRRRTTVHLARQGRTCLARLDALVEAAEAALRSMPQWEALREALDRVQGQFSPPDV